MVTLAKRHLDAAIGIAVQGSRYRGLGVRPGSAPWDRSRSPRRTPWFRSRSALGIAAVVVDTDERVDRVQRGLLGQIGPE